MPREAKIKCPHCGKPITVRQKLSADEVAAQALMDAAHRALKSANDRLGGMRGRMNETFETLFGEKK